MEPLCEALHSDPWGFPAQPWGRAPAKNAPLRYVRFRIEITLIASNISLPCDCAPQNGMDHGEFLPLAPHICHLTGT